MSREPRGVTGHKFVASTEPYLKNQPQPGASSTAVLAAAASSGAGAAPAGSTIQTVTTLRQFEQNVPNKRVKPLPPDANTTAINTATTKLYQLNEHVYFNCAKCRKNNVRSDLLAVNTELNQFICSRCFTRMIRPKNFRPTRLVPFPSLLSWLNYQKPSVTDPTATSNGNPASVSKRFAEAVAPTGNRLATDVALNGFSTGPNASSNLLALPSSALRHEITADDACGQDALSLLQTTHPCLRLWRRGGGDNNNNNNSGGGHCAHGAQLCVFAKAPYLQCLEYLMGIASKEQCEAKEPGLLYDDVFGLPNRADPMPSLLLAAAGAGPSSSSAAVSLLPSSSSDKGVGGGGGATTYPYRYSSQSAIAAELADPSTALGAWYARRRKSPNKAEWQLFNNGPIDHLLAKYYVAPPSDNNNNNNTAINSVSALTEEDDEAFGSFFAADEKKAATTYTTSASTCVGDSDGGAATTTVDSGEIPQQQQQQFESDNALLASATAVEGAGEAVPGVPDDEDLGQFLDML